eukprot:7382607-Prymnesium_polylepis.2
MCVERTTVFPRSRTLVVELDYLLALFVEPRLLALVPVQHTAVLCVTRWLAARLRPADRLVAVDELGAPHRALQARLLAEELTSSAQLSKSGSYSRSGSNSTEKRPSRPSA